ncbi:MAG: hypothetical protein IIX06_07280, partial [Bacteroidales bacterium]|nr:hypothetical protein [Bacteroidales bacterium]
NICGGLVFWKELRALPNLIRCCTPPQNSDIGLELPTALRSRRLIPLLSINTFAGDTFCFTPT